MPRPKREITKKIFCNDIYDYISNTTSLTKDQVKMCLNAYSDFIRLLVLTDSFDETMKITLPNIGYFYLAKRKNNRKKGEVYRMPKRLTSEITTMTVDKDFPEYYTNLSFHVSETIKRALKEKSKKKPFEPWDNKDE